MHLRKSLVTVATVFAAGLLGITAAANAYSSIEINGSATSGSDTVSGQFKSGNASFAGSTYGCTTGSVAGTTTASTSPVTNEFTFSTLSVSCSTPVGAATISLVSPCTVGVDLSNSATVTNAVTDTVSPGTAAFGAGTCVKVTAIFGLCSAYVSGTVSASFNETVKTGGWQDLILNGSGTLVNQSNGCDDLMAGTFTLNNIDFNVKASRGAINFK